MGMNIEWATKTGNMVVSMLEYLYKATEESPETIRGTKSSHTGDHLFSVQEDANWKVLPEEQAR